MSFKTIFIILVTALLTVILMNNTGDIDFWIFGNARIPKLIIMGSMFATGLIVGLLLGRRRPAKRQAHTEELDSLSDEQIDNFSQEDRDYIR